MTLKRLKAIRLLFPEIKTAKDLAEYLHEIGG
mgnify:CR=1 FL=1